MIRNWSNILSLLCLSSLVLGCTQRSSPTCENFNQFLLQFSTDKNFQTSRIIFPLRVVVLNEEYSDTVETLIEENQWTHEYIFFSKYCLEEYPQVYHSHDIMNDQSTERVLAWRGLENGIAVFYYFKCHGGDWYLIRKDDLST